MFQSKFTVISLFFFLLLAHVIGGIFFNGYSPWWIPIIIAIYGLIVYLGSRILSWNFFLKSRDKLSRLRVNFDRKGFAFSRDSKVVALTFDCYPSAEMQVVLDFLKKEKISATFFLTLSYFEENKEAVLKMAQDGHEIGLKNESKVSPFRFRQTNMLIEDIDRLINLIEPFTKGNIRFFRPNDDRTNYCLFKAIQHLGLSSIGRSVRIPCEKPFLENDPSKRKIKRLKERAIIDVCIGSQDMLPVLLFLQETIQQKGFQFGNL